jgi:hypothetical protein
MGWIIRVLQFDSRLGLGIFLFITESRTTLGPTQPPMPVCTRGSFLGIKQPKEYMEIYLHSHNTPFMVWCSVKKKKHRDNLTFTFTR